MPTFTHIARGEVILTFCDSCGIFVAATRQKDFLNEVEHLHCCDLVRGHEEFPRLLAQSQKLLKKTEP